MNEYREVFKPDPGVATHDPGRIFYTVTADDVGKGVIGTTHAVISLGQVLGRVQPVDVGRRLYRVRCNDGESWIWQAESLSQRADRLRQEWLAEQEKQCQ